LLPIGFLRQLIGFYGDSMQQMVLPRYLDYSMKAFAHNQEQMHDHMRNSMGSVFPMGQLEEMGRQNMAVFEKAMQMFSPFGGEPGEENETAPPDEPEKEKSGEDKDQISALERKLDALQAQIEAMSRK
nr:polyhydroxyalkanoate synthesis repressor PhaR [Alphaproteobacteria bacterium]